MTDNDKVPETRSETNHVNIVIVGGNFAGVQVAHMLLANQLPRALEKLCKSLGKPHGWEAFTYKVFLCTPNTSFFFKVATPRAIVDPDKAPDEKIFQDIRKYFDRYGDKFSFVQGKAVGLNTTTKVITVATPIVDEAGITRTIDLPYDFLVIATGTTSVSPLWTLHKSHTNSLDAIHIMRDSLRVKPTATVLIAGAGPVGVETAGEIKVTYPDTFITLITTGNRVLANLPHGVSEKAEAQLKKIGVTVKHGVGLQNPALPDNTTHVELSDGTSKDVDIFINATGARTMNTEWLPEDWLDAKRRVVCGDRYFRVAGGTNNPQSAQHVYALGDVVSGVEQTALHLEYQVPVLTTSMEIDLWKRFGPGPVSKNAGIRKRIAKFTSPSMPAQREYKPIKNTMMVPIGPRLGVGIGMGHSVPSFVVKKVKGDDFMMRLIQPMVTGSKYSGVSEVPGDY